MKSFYLFPTLLASLEVPTVHAFQPTITGRRSILLMSTASSKDLTNQDPMRNIDLKHAHECADNFGECSISEMESMERGT